MRNSPHQMLTAVSVTVALLLTSGAGVASAATVVLNTNTLQGGLAENRKHPRCEALNVDGRKPVSGTLEFVNVSGEVLQTKEFTLGPGAAVGDEYLATWGFTLRCRITYRGRRGAILGQMRLQDRDFNTIAVAPAR